MKILVTGTRGIPEIQGGVETHCQELYPRIAAMGHDVTVVCRAPYVTSDLDRYRGVWLLPLPTPRRKSLEAIVHTWRALRAARRLKPDIVHIHAIGPSLLVPVARIMGFKVVSTNHGPDYDRQKWGRAAKAVLRLGERLGTRWSNRVIAISEVIRSLLAERYGRRDTALIYNGVNRADPTGSHDYTDTLGLAPGRYIVGVGRLVPEKGFHDLIEAFSRSGLHARGWQLAIAGDTDHPSAYATALKARAAAEPGVVMAGFIRGEKMRQLMSNAALMAMPSTHEGLPIALLEAMSYGLDIAVRDIPACRLACLDPSGADFFSGNGNEGAGNLASLLLRKLDGRTTPLRRRYDLSPYDWDTIARQTVQLYNDTLGE